MKKIIIFGASGHGKVVADIVEKSGQVIHGFIDDDQTKWGKDFFGYRIYGGVGFLRHVDASRFSLIVGVGDNHLRRRVAEELGKRNIAFATAIHPSAVIGKNTRIGIGTVVMARVVVSADSVIGDHCILNTACTIGHENIVGDYVHVSPGAHLGGNARIGRLTWVGLGASVIHEVRIGNGIIVGAGTVVSRDLAAPGIYVGTPGRFLKEPPPSGVRS